MLLVGGTYSDGDAEVCDYLVDKAAQIERLHILGGTGTITEQVKTKATDTVVAAR